LIFCKNPNTNDESRTHPEELQLSLIELIHILNISNIHVWLLLQMKEIFIIINFKERKQTQITNVCRHWKVQKLLLCITGY
jgi:hypothetical protein